MSYTGQAVVAGNPAQIDAITHVNGPAMVLAGPGSGKTFVISGRVRFLIEQAGIRPDSILVITFTKAAALEMQHRFFRDTSKRFPEVHFGTFHSLFYQMLCLSKPGYHPNLLTAKDKNRIIKESLSYTLRKHKDEILKKDDYLNPSADDFNSLLSEIARVKNDNESPSACGRDVSFGEYFPDIYDYYTKTCQDLGLIDFEDMILECYKMLMESPEILSKWQNTFKYVLIDEYQDINRLQESVIRLLVRNHKNIFVVGDDDQSIYGFRGSKPQIMQEFTQYYEGAKLITLSINYRSGSDIIKNAGLVIAENKVRFEKNQEPANDDNHGSCIGYVYENVRHETASIASMIEKAGDYDNTAVLYRTNLESEMITLELSARGIPYVATSKVLSIYEDPAIKTILSYLKFAHEGHKRSDFFAIMNCPLRYIKRDSVRREIVDQTDILDYYRSNPNMKESVIKLFRQLKLLEHMRPALSIKYILNEIGVIKFLTQDKSQNEKDRLQDMCDKLMQDASSFQDTVSFLEMAEEQVKIAQKERSRRKGNTDKGVRIMTMHASKGLEFNTVYLPSLCEGVVPNRKSVTPDQIEEERRMLYVGMTRAKKTLILSYIKGDKENARMPSRFLRPIMNLFDDPI
ncbi:DNA helicase-2 / ATP-dependent DNA helicase PcrA [Butyrivibrio fibrisolvens DSM 3071]|uniref:DNA 3'-5' helicase n=1 Tax=Butyrivibrio fibrisolvens DSM 3071 TaxID=1121131 RepID=A0A1M5WM55_BUTFI|nr:ATP-dependent helicase [Butyrivibrio fibrisolvens]SHH88512.1 DNA helicase-2 / ATP-dependent DNA helicase PcrA [Butyrivibrio fibrisolvens DSM 3071]